MAASPGAADVGFLSAADAALLGGRRLAAGALACAWTELRLASRIWKRWL